NILKAFLGPDAASSIGPEMVAAFPWTHPVILILVATSTILFCSRVPAGEVDNGTADILLGLPVSRLSIYAAESVVWIAAGVLLIVMIFVTTRRYIYLFGGIAATALVSKSIFLLEGIVPSHALQRFLIWSDIWRLPHDAAWWDDVYQIMNSFFALNAGGWAGTGLGLGYPTNIPLVVSDFDYAAIAEEIGFLGSTLIVMLYLVLFLLGMRVVVQAETSFEKLLATGFTAMLAIQVFVNIGGVIKLIPLTGITLPFISRGGFSFLISFILVGFLMGLSHRNGMKEIA
ncbi:FtsW/RodA/SpoVE family cell cycle protein, partial [candidate division KSB1 bacterium]|nr:FtsW/RodA/SpoVE family cell cycle protein [candidate division KSB1 bacterium]